MIILYIEEEKKTKCYFLCLSPSFSVILSSYFINLFTYDLFSCPWGLLNDKLWMRVFVCSVFALHNCFSSIYHFSTELMFCYPVMPNLYPPKYNTWVSYFFQLILYEWISASEVHLFAVLYVLPVNKMWNEVDLFHPLAKFVFLFI